MVREERGGRWSEEKRTRGGRGAERVQIVGEGVSCSNNDKQCGKDKAEADPVAGCAVGVRERL